MECWNGNRADSDLLNKWGEGVSKIPLEIAVTLLSRDYKGVNNYGFNGVVERMDEVRVLGQMDNTLDNTFESANRVYDSEGVCPTIPTCTGGGIQPKILETKEVKQNFVSDGNGGITTGCSPEIRKLTPTECGRLMGVDDCDIEKMKKANSNSQLYKQFGNSIVVDVMCAMFRQLNITGVPKWNKE